MIINRAVCIDNPEYDVPWFHTKYCEDIQSLGKICIAVKKKKKNLIIYILYLYFSS